MKLLLDKTCIVTGASRGIGRQIALTLAEMGADIVINYNASSGAAEAVIAAVQALGRKALMVQADVSKSEDAKKLIDAAMAEFGKIDVLVNNAGITRDGLLAIMKEDDWNAVIATNLTGVFNTTKLATKQMLRKKYGRVINISSVVGITGNAGQANYAASKAGVIGFTKSVAREFAQKNITANVVCPGFIETDMTAQLQPAQIDGAQGQIPMRRFGKTLDVSNLVAYLASDLAGYITGQTIAVDGGMSMH